MSDSPLPRPFRRFLPALAAVLLALLAAAAGIAVRRTVLDAQRVLSPDGAPLPFTLESALAYRRVQLAYRDGALPDRDYGIEAPGGVVPREYDTLGAERLLAAAARAWPGTRPHPEKLRWLNLLWFSLAIPGIFCWIRAMGGGMSGGFAGAMLYAATVTAVARSTGQDFLHETDAFPLLAWHLAAWALADRPGLRPLPRLAVRCLSAALLALSLCAWDGIQLYLLFLAATAAFTLVRAARARDWKPWLARWLPVAAALLAAVLLNPYLRAHAFGYAPAYSHFSALLRAKLAFLNRRPADPALLTFDQRILWTPALHSTSWQLLLEWVPVLLPAVLLSALYLFFVARADPARVLPSIGKKRGNLPRLGKNGKPDLPTFGKNNPNLPMIGKTTAWLAVAFAFFFVGFILFFRLHVWVALFGCALFGLAVGTAFARGGRWRIAALVLALAAVGADARHTLAKPLRWASTVGYLPELRGMTTYLREHVAPEPVVANFGVSAAIAAYGGCPVVLHPKFESPAIRQRIESCGETLFKHDEAAFRDWMDAHDAAVYVYSLGEFSTIAPGYQMRYMVDALVPPPDAAARLFEFKPDALTSFVPVYQNRKYRIFRLRDGPTVARHAAAWAARARTAFEEGRFHAAEADAARALLLRPGHPVASRILAHVESLSDAGMPSADDPEDALPTPFAPPTPPPWSPAAP